jgi:hypothetical protein
VTTQLLLHVNERTARQFERALPGSRVAFIARQSRSSDYDERSGLAREYPLLRGLLRQYAPWWSPGEPLVVVAFSAGGWALRYYLRDAQSRGDVTAAIFLDSLYGLQDGECDTSPLRGVIQYGALANASPMLKRLVMTYSESHPAPGACSRAVAAQAGGGGGPGVFELGYAGRDHMAQQEQVGPAVIAQYVAPWLSRSPAVSARRGNFGAVIIVAGILAYVVYRASTRRS